MKKLLPLLLLITFISCNAQKTKVASKKHKEEIHYCNKDSLNKWEKESSFSDWSFDLGGCCAEYVHNGITYTDSTGMAKFNRKVPITDTFYYGQVKDTTKSKIYFTISGGTIKELAVLKVTITETFWNQQRYKDPATGEIIMDSQATGYPKEVNSEFISLSKQPLPKEINIIGEVK